MSRMSANKSLFDAVMYQAASFTHVYRIEEAKQ